VDAKGGGGADRDLGARLYVGWLVVVVVVERFRLDSNKNSRVYLLFGGICRR